MNSRSSSSTIRNGASSSSVIKGWPTKPPSAVNLAHSSGKDKSSRESDKVHLRKVSSSCGSGVTGISGSTSSRNQKTRSHRRLTIFAIVTQNKNKQRVVIQHTKMNRIAHMKEFKSHSPISPVTCTITYDPGHPDPPLARKTKARKRLYQSTHPERPPSQMRPR